MGCKDSESFIELYTRVGDVDLRMKRVERNQEQVVSAVNQQSSAIGRLTSSVEHMRGDLARHEKEIDEVEATTCQLTVAEAERLAVARWWSRLGTALWGGRAYWLMPLFGAAAAVAAMRLGGGS